MLRGLIKEKDEMSDTPSRTAKQAINNWLSINSIRNANENVYCNIGKELS